MPDPNVLSRRGTGRPDAVPEAGSEGHPAAVVTSVLATARERGLLGGEKTAHLSARVAPALLEAAMRETGITSPTELVEYALAALAAPDPVAEIMKRSFGELGPDHDLPAA